ncbi:FAD-dependent monooxygenase, partial [Saccharothrix sp. MB29]|nr:FAD-dependent monooxygenase [Saccharothrix sp. MB29]
MYDVVVIGCGPVGALTANLLGARGVRTLVVERGTEPHGQPRAFSCDDEALRIYQQAGLRAEVAEGMYPPSRAEYVNARGRVFAEIALDEVDFGLGAEPLHFFDQPALEAALRRGLDRFPHVTLRTGTELVGLRQQDDPGGAPPRPRRPGPPGGGGVGGGGGRRGGGGGGGGG